MRHSAWLHAVPKEAKTSRLDSLKLEEKIVSMPLVSAPHIIDYLYEIGPTLAGGMGGVPLSHLEIDAWQRNTGIDLDAWEARFLVRLSREFLAESHKAEAKDRPAPWTEVPVEVDRDQVSRSLFNALESMRKKR